MLVSAGHIHRRPTAIEAWPVSHIGHDQAGHDILARLGTRLERSTVVKHTDVAASLDLACRRINRMDQQSLLALTLSLARLVTVLRVQEGMRLRRHHAQRIAPG